MKKAKGTFWMRSSIVLLALLFGVLVYWSIGFLLSDIHAFKMPNWREYQETHENPAMARELKALQRQLDELNHQHTLLNQQREFIKDSSSSLKITVDNLFRLKNRNQDLISSDQFDRVLVTLDKIILIQDEFKTTATRYIQITDEQFAIQKKIAALKEKISDEALALSKEFRELVRRQRVRQAFIKMAFLIPLLLLCTWLLYKQRASIYRLIFASTAGGVYLQTARVMHDHFPSRYFKYVLTVCMLLLVAWGFRWLIRRLVRPQLDILLKQYRQAYERFLCPVCEYPIRTGPRKYLFWTRRTVHKTALNAAAMGGSSPEEPYTCPVCGTNLFEKCATCGGISHSLLPNCQHCGAEKDIKGEDY